MIKWVKEANSKSRSSYLSLGLTTRDQMTLDLTFKGPWTNSSFKYIMHVCDYVCTVCNYNCMYMTLRTSYMFKRMSDWTSEWPNKLMNRWVNELLKKWMRKRTVNGWKKLINKLVINKRTTEWMNDWTNEWTTANHRRFRSLFTAMLRGWSPMGYHQVHQRHL